ncbi:hypothetical protein [Actinocorallia longicatena]|uniref:Secreted protein n=1 Tax=Actinocorallia longicatena TaxID=111803 RepID=A0ABP6QCY6_9ACTN
MARTQARTMTVLRAALSRAARSRVLHRVLTVAGLVAVGWLIGGAGAAQAGAEPPRTGDTVSQAVSAVLRVTAREETGTTVPQASTTAGSVETAAPALPGAGAFPEIAPAAHAAAHRPARADGAETAGQAVPDTLVAAGHAVTGTVATAHDAVPQAVETAGTVPNAVPDTSSTAPGAVAAETAEDEGARTPPSPHGTVVRAGNRPVRASGPEDSRVGESVPGGRAAEKKAAHRTRHGHEAARHEMPQAPARTEAGALPPAVNGGGAVTGGWIALPHRRHGACTARRLVLVLAPRLGAGLPPVNTVVDEPSFSPD